MVGTCLSCGGQISEETHRLFLSDRRKGLPGSWQLDECIDCGFISMMPMPTDEQLSAYYSVYSKDDKVDLSRKAGSHYPKLRKLFHRISGDVDPRDFVVVPAGARVLDYGCGHASYLCDFHDRGVAITGVEIAGHLVKACVNSDLDVRKAADFSHISFEDAEFDIVYLMQVFEHLRDPHGFMNELARILKSGGMLYLAVPNAASIWRKVFRNNWVSGWFTPFHLCHYNRETLAKLAGQHGFDIMESWSSTPESWFRLNLKACLYPKENQLDWRKSWLDSKPIRYLLMLVLRIVELPIKERDCLVVKFKKRV